MRTKILLILTCFAFTFSHAQNVAFGFQLGLDYPDFQLDKDFSLNNEIQELTTESKLGFHLGVHSCLKVANRVKISPQLQLVFTENSFEVGMLNGEKQTVNFENVLINIPIDLHLELLRGSTALYLISGVEYTANIADEDESVRIDLKKSYWSGRLGLGLRQNLMHFSISPELTFSKSFESLESDDFEPLNQVITNLDNSLVSLNIKFQGLLSN